MKWTHCAGFTAENRTKLSYHVDGFAQFSSENQGRIISGRDPNTGEPKGLGIMTRPFSNPITSGPSVGIGVWGLEDFEETDQDEKLIVFEPPDFYYRLWGPDETNLWQLGIYVFNGVPPVRFDGNQAKMDFALTYPPTAGVVGSIVTLKMIRLEAEKVSLGLYVESLLGAFPSKSGWQINGPGNWNSTQGGYVLNAVYPRDLIPVDQRPSLDYKPPPNNEVNSARGKNARPAKRERRERNQNRRRESKRIGTPHLKRCLNGNCAPVDGKSTTVHQKWYRVDFEAEAPVCAAMLGFARRKMSATFQKVLRFYYSAPFSGTRITCALFTNDIKSGSYKRGARSSVG